LVPALATSAETLAPKYFRHPPRKAFIDYEPQHYLHMLTWKKPPNDPDAPGTVLPLEDQYDCFRSIAYYVKDLRNKYDHDNDERLRVPPEEELADCLVLLRFAARARHLLPEATHAEAIEGIILTHLPRLVSILVESRSLLLHSEHTPALPAVIPSPQESTEGSTDRSVSANTEPKLDALVTFALELSQYLDESRKESLAIRSLLTSMEARYVTLADHLSRQTALSYATDDEEDPLDDLRELDEPVLNDHQPSCFVPPPPLSLDEARELLIALRWRIWDELETGATSDGILRKRMMNSFLNSRATSAGALQAAVSPGEWEVTAPSQVQYLPEILAIVQRIQAE
jgi:hypothetical protein